MEQITILDSNGLQKEVSGLLYAYEGKYYFIYTDKELDENGYVVLHLCQVGKEVINKDGVPTETGYMVGIEISNPEEWQKVQESITKIVESKKEEKENPEIHYFPTTMLGTLKVTSSKTFRLIKSVLEKCFNIEFPKIDAEEVIVGENKYNSVIDYRTSFFEEQQKNAELQTKIQELEEKIASIKSIIE